MNNVVDRRPVDEAFKVLLEANTPMPIGKGKAPIADNDSQAVVEPPYAIIYPISGGSWWGPPWGATEDAADLNYQVTSVGLREDQAQWAADLVRQVVLGRDDTFQLQHGMTVAGIHVLDREGGGPPGGVTTSGKIYSVVDVYTVKVSMR